MEKSNKIINAGIGYTVGNILIKGISFLTIPLYTRLMSTSDYGIYNTYTAYVSILTFIMSMGMDPTLKNAEYDYRNSKSTYLSTVYLLTFIPFFFCIIVILLFGEKTVELFKLDKPVLLLLVVQAEMAAILNIYNIKLSLNYASKNYLKIALFNTVCSIILSVLLMLTVLEENRYLGRIIGAVVPLAIVGIMIILKKVIFGKQKKFDFGMAGYALRLGLPLIPHLVSQIINSQFDRIMISSLVGYSEAGIYSFTYNIAIILQIIYQSLDNVWSPWFFKQMDAKDYDSIQKVSKKYMMLMVFFTVSLMTVSREFIMFFSTEDYWDGITLCPILILGIFFLYLYNFPVGIEYFTKNTKYVAFGSLVTAGINIILNYFSIKIFGYKAAAYTTLFSYIILFMIHWLLYKKLRPQKIYKLTDIFITILFVAIWAVIVTLTNEIWILKYIFYVIFIVIEFYYFKEDIKGYLINRK